MKQSLFTVVLVLSFVIISGISYAGHVSGYTKKNGTHVSSYNKKSSNNTVRDNYSYKGNANPFTQKSGTNKYTSSKSSEYYKAPELK
jgi:hypothetical protein